MAGVNEVVQVWEDAISRWRAGDERLPAPLDAWRASYQGRGTGIVDLEAIPEPYLGSWSEARAAVLALNPGQVLQGFQYRGGVFDREIGERGSYAAWATSWPFVRPPWTDHFPPVRHITSRLRFLCDWFDDPKLSYNVMLAVELYPWHSTKVTAPIRPDPGVVREFVLEPLTDSGLRELFAFGAPWFAMLTDHLGLER
jgi:hypothetical protein